MSICIVEDDASTRKLLETLLTKAGATVKSFESSIAALKEIPRLKPDVVLTDIMMPEMDGLQLCTRLIGDPTLPNLKVVVLSAKTYKFDRDAARHAGASGFITKPLIPSTLVGQLLACVEDAATINYWGVRGTLPVPGPHSLRYGGNTSCVSIAFPKQRNFVFDAGTGIKKLSDSLLARQKSAWSAKVFISHPHWDHINAIPFFVPMFIPGNEFEIIGAKHGKKTMRELISAQMDDVYFPITMKEMGARIYFRDIGAETIMFDDIEVKSMLLSHPGNCLGYRVKFGGKVFCYITDNEIYPKDLPQNNPEYEKNLSAFIQDADIALMDSCYFDAEYRKKVDWGHSSVNEVVRIAHAAGVRELQLFHHDPDQGDDLIDRKLETANNLLSDLKSNTVCTAPQEGDSMPM